MSRQVYTLVHQGARQRAAQAVLVAPDKTRVTLEDGKTRDQEQLVHSCYEDFARCVLISGARMSAKKWKTTLKYAFYLETKDDETLRDDWASRAPEMVPMLNGQGFVMTEIESRHFTKALYSAFITFLHSEGDARGVQWSKTSLGREWAWPDEPATA